MSQGRPCACAVVSFTAVGQNVILTSMSNSAHRWPMCPSFVVEAWAYLSSSPGGPLNKAILMVLGLKPELSCQKHENTKSRALGLT